MSSARSFSMFSEGRSRLCRIWKFINSPSAELTEIDAIAAAKVKNICFIKCAAVKDNARPRLKWWGYSDSNRGLPVCDTDTLTN